MQRRNAVLSLLFAIGLIVSLAAPAIAAPSGGTSSASADYTTASTWKAEPEECTFLGLINDYRKQNNAGALTISLTLSAAAEDHSIDMANNGYFSHTLADGTTWSQNIANHGYPTNTSRAENTAAGRSTAAEVFSQWRNSAGHNANMLNPKFNAIGIGRYALKGSRYTYYWTNTFGSRVDKPYTCTGATSVGGGEKPGTQLTITGGGRTTSSTVSTSAYDGELSTAWYTTTSKIPSAAYVYFDLGTTKQLGSIKWYFSKSGYCDSLKVQVSTDKKTWTTLTTRTSSKAGSWQSVKTTSKARYVRFYVGNPNKDKVLGYIAEVKIYS